MKSVIVFAFLLIAAACVSARNPGQFAPPGCGPNSRMDLCSDGCVASCDPSDCRPSDTCVEECICFEGYVKNPSGSGCIEHSECDDYFNEFH